MNCNALLNRLQSTNTLSRVHLYALALYTGIAAFDATTRIGRAFDYATSLGDVIAAVMVASAMLGIIDAIINDMMPERWYITSALNWRHMVLMSLSICYALAMTIAVAAPSSKPISIYFAINTIGTITAAFFDVRRRLKRVT